MWRQPLFAVSNAQILIPQLSRIGDGLPKMSGNEHRRNRCSNESTLLCSFQHPQDPDRLARRAPDRGKTIESTIGLACRTENERCRATDRNMKNFLSADPSHPRVWQREASRRYTHSRKRKLTAGCWAATFC